jgi:hypothetical protein
MAQVSELFQGAHARLAPEVTHLDLDAVRRFEPWLHAAAEGAPAALLPFAIDVR